MNSATTLSGRALYTVPEAMEMLNLSRTVIYEQIRSGRLLTVTQGPPPGSSFIHDGVRRSSRDRSDGSYQCPDAVARRGLALLGRIAAAVDGGRRCRI